MIILRQHAWTHLLANKEQVKQILVGLLAHLLNHFKSGVKRVRSDNGTEIFQQECGKILAEKGIFHERSVPG